SVYTDPAPGQKHRPASRSAAYIPNGLNAQRPSQERNRGRHPLLLMAAPCATPVPQVFQQVLPDPKNVLAVINHFHCAPLFSMFPSNSPVPWHSVIIGENRRISRGYVTIHDTIVAVKVQ